MLHSVNVLESVIVVAIASIWVFSETWLWGMVLFINILVSPLGWLFSFLANLWYPV